MMASTSKAQVQEFVVKRLVDKINELEDKIWELRGQLRLARRRLPMEKAQLESLLYEERRGNAVKRTAGEE